MKSKSLSRHGSLRANDRFRRFCPFLLRGEIMNPDHFQTEPPPMSPVNHSVPASSPTPFVKPKRMGCGFLSFFLFLFSLFLFIAACLIAAVLFVAMNIPKSSTEWNTVTKENATAILQEKFGINGHEPAGDIFSQSYWGHNPYESVSFYLAEEITPDELRGRGARPFSELSKEDRRDRVIRDAITGKQDVRYRNGVLCFAMPDEEELEDGYFVLVRDLTINDSGCVDFISYLLVNPKTKRVIYVFYVT